MDTLTDIIDFIKKSFYTGINSIVSSIIQLHMTIMVGAMRLIYPAVKAILYLLFALLLANGTYYIMYKLFFPVDLIDEPLHFDYLANPTPIAKLRLTSIEKQWEYISGERKAETSLCQRFFRSHSEYDVSLKFRLYRTARNQDVGKCMVTLSMVDCAGDVLGVSSRVLRVPYSSQTISWLSLAYSWPLYVLGIASESDVVEIPMMNRYREGSRIAPPTDTVEVRLSESAEQMDVEAAYLSITPLPRGIGYILYFFPYASFFGGVLFLFYFFLALGLLVRLARSNAAKQVVSFISDTESDVNDGPEDDSISIGDGDVPRRRTRGRLFAVPESRSEELSDFGSAAESKADSADIVSSTGLRQRHIGEQKRSET